MTTPPDPDPAATRADHLRRSRIAAGIGLVLAIMLVETLHVHRAMPSPYSPFVWAGLGTGAVASLLYAWWARRRARAPRDGEPGADADGGTR